MVHTYGTYIHTSSYVLAAGFDLVEERSQLLARHFCEHFLLVQRSQDILYRIRRFALFGMLA